MSTGVDGSRRNVPLLLAVVFLVLAVLAAPFSKPLAVLLAIASVAALGYLVSGAGRPSSSPVRTPQGGVRPERQPQTPAALVTDPAPNRPAVESVGPTLPTNKWVQRAAEAEQAGQLDAARAIYQEVSVAGEPVAAAEASLRLGSLEQSAGHLDAARTAYRQAIDSGSQQPAHEAWFCLGMLEQEAGRGGEAREAYLKAMAASDPATVQLATEALSNLDQPRA